MPLSIDEAGTRCTLTGEDSPKRKRVTNERGKGFAVIPYIYGTFTKSKGEKEREENWQCKIKQIISKIKAENPIADETFLEPGSSIHVQPDELRRQDRSSIKNPAVAAAGRRHAVFPAVSPGRTRCLAGETTRPADACQHSVQLVPAAMRLTRS
jgi:hypothetical protein